MKPKTPPSLLIVRILLAAVGVSCLCYWATVTLRGKIFQTVGARRFNDKARQAPMGVPDSPKQPAAARPAVPAEGFPVAKLTIPDLGVALIVVEGVSDSALAIGPGHVRGTAFPGEPGNIGIAGHRDTVFRPLRFVHKNQIIGLTTVSGDDRYRVVSTSIVSPTDTEVLKPTGRDTLTLITCYPFNFIGPAPKRFIVKADRVSSSEGSDQPPTLLIRNVH